MIASFSLHANCFHQSGELLLLRLQTLPQPLLVLLVSLQQASLEPSQVAEELILASSELAVQLLIILLEVAFFLFALGKGLVPACNCILEYFISLPASLHQFLIVILQFLHFDLQLLPSDQQALVLQILLSDLVLSDDGGQRPRETALVGLG